MMRQILIKKLVGDMSTLSTIPPHHKLESIFFNISYGNVPLKSNKPEVNEKKMKLPNSHLCRHHQ